MSRACLTALGLFCLAGCMEGQKPEPLPRTTLYERLGKERGIERIVDAFVDAVRASPDIPAQSRRRFEEAKENPQVLKRELTIRISKAAGGPPPAVGRDEKRTPGGTDGTYINFNALAPALEEALKQNKVPEHDRKELLSRLAPGHLLS
jgi:truncated hemoglobin YjbI